MTGVGSGGPGTDCQLQDYVRLSFFFFFFEFGIRGGVKGLIGGEVAG